MSSKSYSNTKQQDNRIDASLGSGTIISPDANQALPGSIAAEIGMNSHLNQDWENVVMHNSQFTPEIAAAMQNVMTYSLASQSQVIQAVYDRKPKEITTAMPTVIPTVTPEKINLWPYVGLAIGGLIIFTMRR